MKKNKKAMLYQEFILAAVVTIVISVLLYFSANAIVLTNKDINEIAPELSYQFPATYVHSYLFLNIKKEDIKDLGLDENQKYKVKDIIKINTQDSREIAKKYRKIYIDSMIEESSKKPLDYYNYFADENIDEEETIRIQTDIKQLPDLGSEIKNKNYFFYLKNEDNTYSVIYFI